MRSKSRIFFTNYMKPHITNLEHQKFSLLMEDTIKKMEEIPNEEKTEVAEKITELKSNKQTLEEIYSTYQSKLKELRGLLDEYEKVQQLSRIHLRKMQLWLKFTYTKLIKSYF